MGGTNADAKGGRRRKRPEERSARANGTGARKRRRRPPSPDEDEPLSPATRPSDRAPSRRSERERGLSPFSGKRHFPPEAGSPGRKPGRRTAPAGTARLQRSERRRRISSWRRFYHAGPTSRNSGLRPAPRHAPPVASATGSLGVLENARELPGSETPELPVAEATPPRCRNRAEQGNTNQSCSSCKSCNPVENAKQDRLLTAHGSASRRGRRATRAFPSRCPGRRRTRSGGRRRRGGRGRGRDSRAARCRCSSRRRSGSG